MSGIGIVVLVFFVLAAGLGGVAYFTYQHKLRRAKAIERGLKMVPILIHLPPQSSDTQAGSRDLREVMREKTSQAEVLYNLISGTATEGFKSTFYGQRHIALEVIAIDGLVHFYAAVPVALVSVVEKAIQTAYPGARLEQVEDHNIFNQEGRLAATLGGEMVLREEYSYPIATYEKLDRDPMEAMLTTVSALGPKDGVAVQIMLRPANRKWTERSIKLADGKRRGRSQNLSFTAMDLAKAAVKSPEQRMDEEHKRLGGGAMVSNLELGEVERIEEKTKHPGFEVLVRVIVSTESVARSQQLLRDIATAFALFETPGMNGFKFLPALDVQGLVTAFIFRFFPPELKSNILNSQELATLFHFPDSQFMPTSSVERQKSKQVDGPVHLPTTGLIFGHNEFRGVKKEIRLSVEDRRRHTYILGQTGTGKSTMLENLAVQDMLNGNGFAFIDPHGDSAEKLLALVPKERAEDVIYFNPSDTEYPLGLNLFEFTDPAQKDFLVQETINMLYKLYDPEHTGIIGPRYEHWYRNAALTLMSDPNGATFIEIPKVFTDTDYLKSKFKYLRDPTVIDFWTKEMGQTSDYHKSEMLGWFVSKFGAFQNNEMMRNIIGQTKSSFNMREVMDQKKILIVNLSKGRIGELNSQLLGMIFVIKFQAAAMSRADVPEEQRPDFSMYVDEFQNFSTDSFASILSEARKYRLNLIVANQFIGQLKPEIRDAVFGNIGTIVAHRMGPEDAEFMVKQFAPVFDTSDLVNIPNYNAAMRLMIGGLPSQPFTLRDSAPLGQPNLELGLAVKQLSAAKFGHSKAVVEADILERFAGKSAPTALPEVAPGAPAPVAPAPAPTEAVAAAPLVPVPATVTADVPEPAQVAPVAPVAPVQVIAAKTEADVTLHPAGHVLTSGASVQVHPGTGLIMRSPAPAPAIAVPSAKPAGLAPAAETPTVSPASQMTNTAGQVLTSVAPIIPEDTDDAAPNGDAAMEGGFGDLSAPLGAPSVPPAAQPVPDPSMAMAPPPIGAPPIELPPIAAPPIGAPPVDTISAPVAAVSSPVPAPAPLPALAAPAQAMQAPVAAPPPMAMQAAAPAPVLAPMPAPIQAPAQLQAAPAYAAAPPPPVAAVNPLVSPPVGPAQTSYAPVQAMTPTPAMAAVAPAGPSAPGTLSLSDITGGRPMPRVDPASVPIMTPGTEPMQAATMTVPARTRPIAPVAPLGSGVPLEGDPYSNIPVIGDLTPPGAISEAAPVEPSRMTATGQALPNDPYASIDVLGNGVASTAALSPTAPVPAIAPAPAPALLPPVSAPAAPAPVAPAALVAPASMVAAPAPVAQAPVAVSTPAPAAMPAPTPQPMAAPAPQPPAPLPPPAPSPQPIAPAAPAPMPAPVYQAPAPAPVAAAPASIVTPPVQAAAPMAVREPVAPAPSAPAEPLIHFVDPAAEEVLNRPDVPNAVEPQNEEGMLLNGLPEGVAFTEPEPAAQTPVAASAPPVPSATVNEPASPASIVVPAPLSNMAKTPPPIGAAPVDIGVAPAPALAPESKPASEAKTPPKAEPVPETNATLARALIKSPEPTPIEVKKPEVEVKPEAKVEVKPAEPVTAPEVKVAVKPEVKVEVKPEVKPAGPTVEPPKPAPEAKVETGPASKPQPAMIMPEKPRPEVVSPATQIEKAEHEIDDLLSVSLIHDSSAMHRRLPEPVAPAAQANETGVDLELNAARSATPATPAPVAEHAPQHHGLKVIQPTGPIVPPREEIAKEIAAMQQAEQAAATAQAGTKAQPPAAPVKTPVVAIATPVPVPAAVAPPVIVKHEGQILAEEKKPADEAVATEQFDELPQSVSLAATDVAKARAEREASLVMQKPAPVADEPVSTPAPTPVKAPEEPVEKKENRILKHKPKLVNVKVEPKKPEKTGEHVASQEEADHNKPSQAEQDQSTLVGKLIVPTGEKPKPEPVQPKTEKPKKLAPGEVFVDENGNVVIGE